MQANRNTLAAAVVLVGCLSSLPVEQAAGIEVPGNSPFCGPCIPARASYGYFPTTWRRWPTSQQAPAAARQPTALPTPAQPATPAFPDTPSPSAPGQPLPQPGATPLDEPPFGEPPAMPKADEGPIDLPFGEEPLPFDDSPPVLPTEPQDSSQPAFDPTVPSATPTVPSATPPTQPQPGTGTPPPPSDAPPTMPDDDPFRDDPVQDILPPANPQPEGNTDPLQDILPPANPPAPTNPGAQSSSTERPATLGWRRPGAAVQRQSEAPRILRKSAAEPLADQGSTVGLRLDDHSGASSPQLPGSRENPLRSARRTPRPREIVPAASFATARATRAAASNVRWRANPLRSE